jgi:DNA repair exonuclease SbcCD ATPase subunit
MAGFLAQLDAIARLEDGSVIKTRSLISQDQEMSGIWAVRKKRTNLEEILLELKRRSDHWQECIAAQKEIENVEPLLETYQEAEFQRKQALELITAAGSRQSKRTWPPSSTSLEAERLELDRIEEEWQSLKDRSGKAISLVAQYSQLSSRYHSLGERLRQAVNRREQEQRQVEDLEEQIVALIEPWESMLAQYRDNPTASREIRELLSSMDEEMENLERGYLRNELDYEQVIQQMRNLQRRVRYYQVALDDEHALDASGRIARRRQSERDVF